MNERTRNLAIFGGVGGGLALLYMLTRQGSGPVVVGADASLQSAFNRLVEDIQAQFATERETTESALEAFKTEVSAEQQEAAEQLETTLAEYQTEQQGVLSSLWSSVQAAAAQIQNLLGRTAALEKQVSTVAAQAAKLPANVVTQQQALVMEQDTRMQAAMAATLGKISQFGTSQVPGYAERIAEGFGRVWNLRPEQMNTLKSWARAQSDALARNQLGVGSSGVDLPSLLPGPMGFRPVNSTIPANREKPLPASLKIGVRL